MLSTTGMASRIFLFPIHSVLSIVLYAIPTAQIGSALAFVQAAGSGAGEYVAVGEASVVLFILIF